MANKTNQELWEERILSFQASGLSRRAWCQEQKLPEHQLGYWLRKLQPKEVQSGSGRWVAVQSNCFLDTGVSIQIGDAVLTVRQGFDSQVLADVYKP